LSLERGGGSGEEEERKRRDGEEDRRVEMDRAEEGGKERGLFINQDV
jgi:hypothetical protein